ncbi:MAG: riboflavin biosynthesis protein RibF [Proteobacteria bacterium]|jgi:riboflavin kinase/FMN adenylyltransferase|nr:riboflavin biosynthesis protein RibF [Pseudomonadota bacterium]
MYRIIINQRSDAKEKSIVTIGNFDGMHLGHMQLFTKLNKIANIQNLRRIVVTFEPLPLEYFADCKKEQRLARLGLLRDKYLFLKNLGFIDELVIIRFNASLCDLSPSQFTQQVLIKELKVTHVVIGHDFRFGKNATGGKEDLLRHNIDVTTVEPYYIENNRVSSSIVRQFAMDNNLHSLKQYLGRNIHYTSRVVHGNHLGRKFGVPTINLCVGHNRPALWGIYIAYVYIDGIRYNSVASIGKNPTISDMNIYKLEAHLLDVDLDLYGKIATVEILEFLRLEQKFSDLNTLFVQIHRDLDNSREFFKG